MKRIFCLCVIASLLSVFQSIFACTIVSCSLKGEVFAAANEDEYTPFSNIWFVPPAKGRYGSVSFGSADLMAQSAMNEYGLFFDFTAQSGIDPSKYSLKNIYPGDLFVEILGKCKNVKEVLEYFKKYDYSSSSQVLFADAEGNSVVMNAGIVVKKTGNFQINTNFNIANQPTHNYRCKRYDLSEALLSSATEVSVPLLRKVLERSHQEGKLSTQYSQIFDLKRGIIHVYLFHNFEEAYVIDLKKELKKGYRLEKLSDHFEPSFAYDNYARRDPLYKKEQLLEEIKKNGLDTTVNKYQQLLSQTGKKDSLLAPAVLEVALQLIKNSWNQHASGGSWEYWFSLPAGYQVSNFKDKRLDAASRLLGTLWKEGGFDPAMKNFLLEISAYLHLVDGNVPEAKEYYLRSVLNPSETYPNSYARAREMLKRIN